MIWEEGFLFEDGGIKVKLDWDFSAMVVEFKTSRAEVDLRFAAERAVPFKKAQRAARLRTGGRR